MARWLTAFLVVLGSLLVAGCGGGGGRPGQATIRFINLVPDSTALEFLLDDDVIDTPKPYLASTPTFARFEAGEKDVRIRESGTTVDIWAELGTFTADRDYLIMALGLENFNGEFDKRARIGGIDVNRAVPNGNRARIYVVHAYNRMVGFQTPNIDFQTPGENPQYKVADVPFGGNKNIEIDSGSYTFEVRRAGTTNVLFTTTATLGAGKIYVASVTGVEGAGGAQAPQVQFTELQTK